MTKRVEYIGPDPAVSSRHIAAVKRSGSVVAYYGGVTPEQAMRFARRSLQPRVPDQTTGLFKGPEDA